MKTIALVGASNNPDKFWYKILKNLLEKNHKVFPVNPKAEKILSQQSYKTIWEIDQEFEIVNFVTQPNITKNILENNLNLLENKILWFQPWSTDEICEKFIQENFKNFILNSCIMIEKI